MKTRSWLTMFAAGLLNHQKAIEELRTVKRTWPAAIPFCHLMLAASAQHCRDCLSGIRRGQP
jgi:hypothetical protein